jgi:pectate lyase
MSIRRRSLSAAFALMASATLTSVAPGQLTSARIVIGPDGRVVDSSLFDGNEPAGFAAGTTGGLGGRVYVVTSTADDGADGTLRYGVETLTEARWIVFDPNVFPPNVKTTIDLQRPLQIIGADNPAANNLTIDGRGSRVSLRRSVSWGLMLGCWYEAGQPEWNRVCWDPDIPSTYGSAYECFKEPGAKVGPLINIKSAKNIIITHIDFAKVRTGTPPPTPIGPHWLDDQCFEDMISVYNLASERDTQYYDRIWINRSEFRDCGDECVAVTSASSNGYLARVTLSRNLFASTNKGLMISGGPEPLPPSTMGLAASVYQNRFVSVKMRQPRVELAYADVFNNLYENWLSKAIDAQNYSRVTAEQNVFRSVTTASGAWTYSGVNAYLWARGNVKSDSAITGTSRSPFPACSSAGGPFYNDCSVPMFGLSSTSYAAARDWVRARSGWAPTANDVRDAAQ